MTPTAGNLGEALTGIREKIQASNAERLELSKQLNQIMEDARQLLSELGGGEGRLPSPLVRKRGRPRKAVTGNGLAGPGKTTKRSKLSGAVRKKMSDARKAYWAKRKAGERKK